MLRVIVMMLAVISSFVSIKAEEEDSIVSVPTPINENSIIDEVIWVVGDEAILKSDVEAMRLQAEQEGTRWDRDPDCAIPEQIAVQKLFLNQAIIDSIEVGDADVSSSVEEYIDYWISLAGSKEKLEEYKGASISQLRDELREALKDRQTVERVREHLVENIKVSPAEVRRYFKDMPEDSIPFVQTEVEVQIITQTPQIEQQELNRIKEELREYTDRINSGESSFATLARLYSEDPGSARRGGEMDYAGRAMFDPAFSEVAFSLTDPTKVSKIVESEFGFHIIQLIDKRGDKIKVRHILRKPQVSEEAVKLAIERLDTVKTDIEAGVITFEQAVNLISDDKDTRNNYGLMTNLTDGGRTRTSRFQMQDLPSEVAKVIDTMAVGTISSPFQMINEKGKTVVLIAKLKNRIEGHTATITEDFQVLQALVLEKRKEEKIRNWVTEKIKSTYVRINDRYKDCDFEYQGWIR